MPAYCSQNFKVRGIQWVFRKLNRLRSCGVIIRDWGLNNNVFKSVIYWENMMVTVLAFIRDTQQSSDGCIQYISFEILCNLCDLKTLRKKHKFLKTTKKHRNKKQQFLKSSKNNTQKNPKFWNFVKETPIQETPIFGNYVKNNRKTPSRLP